MIETREQPVPRTITRGAALRRFLPWTLALTDIVLIYAAFALAYWLRYDLEIGPQIKSRVTFEAYQPLALLVMALMVVILFIKSAYRPRLSTDVVDEVGTIMSAATLTVGLMVVVTAMLQQEQYSRAVTVYLWILLIVVLSLGRALYRAVQGYCHRKGWGTLRVLVVGATDAGMMAMQGMMNRPDLGYELAGFVYDRPGAQIRDFGRFRALGTVGDIPHLIEEGSIDEVIIALPASAHEDVWRILTLCEQHGVALKLIPDLFEMSLSRVQVDDIAGIPLLDVGEKPLRRMARLTKRVLDVTIAGVMLLINLPLLLVLIVLIRLESKGSPILRQERVGMGGKSFTCLKLRTMADGADELRPALQTLNEAQGPMFKIRNDPRLTRVGRWMRVWSLDEIPQVVNVLRGDMSIVGPRPPLPAEAAEYDARHMRRLEVKPGMTGIWQVSGRSDLPFDEMVMMDIYYVDNWSLALDIRIMFRTITAVLRRRGAY